MRFGLAILLAAAAPVGASLAEQVTLRGAKEPKQPPAGVEATATVKKRGRNRLKTTAMGDDGTRMRKQRKNDSEAIVEERFVTVPKVKASATTGENEEEDKPKPGKKGHIDKATYRAQKEAEREAKLAEKKSKREAEEALRESKRAEKEAKKAELKAEKDQEKSRDESKKSKKSELKENLDAADNSTSVGEAEDDSSNSISLRSDEDGWMPTPSPIDAMTPFPTEPPMALICPDEYDPERTEPYKAGDQVTVQSNIFECQGEEFEEFCSISELSRSIKKEHKDAKKLWKGAWKYVTSCTVAEIEIESDAIESAANETADVVEIEAEIEIMSDALDSVVSNETSDEVVEIDDTEKVAESNTSVIEIEDDGDVSVEDEIEGEVTTDGAVDIDSLLQPRSAGLEQHNWDMGFDFAEEPCVSDVCNHQISHTCLLKYQVHAQQMNLPSTITMELICEGVTWLGIGFSKDGLMAGSEAVIGVLGEEPKKYSLDGRWMGGVKPMDDSQQTLIDASINVYRGPITVLKFTKIMEEQGEIKLKPGENTFLYAQGQSYFLGQHDSRGSFQLNLPSVEASGMDMDRTVSDGTETAITTVAPTTTAPDEPCTTEWCEKDLNAECKLKYIVNYPVDEPGSITMDLSCEGESWIGIGFSSDGNMDGSEAVIAGPGQEPRKYLLGGKWPGPGGVVEMQESQQTLIDAKTRVKWVEGLNGWFPLMKMRFTKLLSEPNEIEITPGDNMFLYAQGSTPSFPSYHAARDSFTLTLPSDGSSNSGSVTVAPAAPEMQITELSDECKLKHVVNVPEYTTRDVCEDCSITMELTCDSEGWVAIGFSIDGFMPRSEAVVGIPGRNPEKYYLKRRSMNKIFRLPNQAQTLSDASVTVDDGVTVMRFTKLLNEPNEIPITQELYFLFAHGNGNFGYHGPNNRGSVRLNLL